MKVLLVNGSPHENGCTFRALQEVGEGLFNMGVPLPHMEPPIFTNFV